MKKISFIILSVVMLFMLCACGNINMEPDIPSSADDTLEITDTTKIEEGGDTLHNLSENFVLISGGTFQMGSPEDEVWRLEDEMQHTVTVSDFYISIYELTQAEYQEIMGENPSNFSGDDARQCGQMGVGLL